MFEVTGSDHVVHKNLYLRSSDRAKLSCHQSPEMLTDSRLEYILRDVDFQETASEK